MEELIEFENDFSHDDEESLENNDFCLEDEEFEDASDIWDDSVEFVKYLFLDQNEDLHEDGHLEPIRIVPDSQELLVARASTSKLEEREVLRSILLPLQSSSKEFDQPVTVDPKPSSSLPSKEDENKGVLYEELLSISENNLVIYPGKIFCPLCTTRYPENTGIILKECLHVFCRGCLTNNVKRLYKEVEIKCPLKGDETCDKCILEVEIQALLTPERYEKRLTHTLKYAADLYCEEWSLPTNMLSLPSDDEEDLQGAIGGAAPPDPPNEWETRLHYEQLASLTSGKLVTYPDPFKCPICFDDYGANQGIILKNCLHVFCRECLTEMVRVNDDVDIKCPYRDDDYACTFFILEVEVQALLSPADYNKRLERTLAFAELNMKNTFHCKKANCTGWWEITDESMPYDCPVCKSINCVKCKAIHDAMSCEQYKMALSGASPDVIKSETLLEDLLAQGQAMRCPKCTAIVSKTTGCDGMTCSYCKLALCWATKKARWGPKGPGDNSGGCMCNVNGIKCHPSCSNCH